MSPFQTNIDLKFKTGAMSIELVGFLSRPVTTIHR